MKNGLLNLYQLHSLKLFIKILHKKDEKKYKFVVSILFSLDLMNLCFNNVLISFESLESSLCLPF